MKNSNYSDWSNKDLVNEIKKLKERKTYGIVWEEEKTIEKFDIDSEKKLPILKEIHSKAIQTNKKRPTNILIEGDNYHALSILNYTHEKKIDVIYIDPPYNTGAKDWKYNNNYVDEEDGYRHSKWLSFMKKRLRLAKKLLKKNGILICAIDDNEFGSLGLLLDQIFPNKIKNTVIIVSNPHGVSRNGFSRNHEYAIFLLNKGQTINKRSAPEDNREINLRRSGNNSLRADSPTMFYPIFIDKKTKMIIGGGEVPEVDFHPNKRIIEKPNSYEIWPIDDHNIEKNWYYSKKRVNETGQKELFCKSVKGKLNVYFHHSNNSEQKYNSVWTDKKYDAGAYGSTLIKNIVGIQFPFPKSLHTMLDCLKAVIPNKDSIILDFFAGSGTTAHAVLQLNKEDNGNRKFILCTNNENNICTEVCYPRVKKVISGYKNLKEEKIEGLGGNLKYFKTDFVDGEPTDKNKKNLVDQCTEMLCLKEDCFDELKQTKNYSVFKNHEEKYFGIVYDDDGIEHLKKQIKSTGKKFNVYVFSLDDSAREEEFEDVRDMVDLQPIPEVMLNVYRRISK